MVALAFRHMDCLGSGLPILGYPNTALQDIAAGAGVFSADIQATTEAWLTTPRLRSKSRQNAAQVAAEHHWSKSALPLLNWLQTPAKRSRSTSQLMTWISKAAAHDEVIKHAEVSQAQRLALEEEVLEKRNEVEKLTQQIQTQLGIMDRLSRAVDEVRFKGGHAVLDTRVSIIHSLQKHWPRECHLLQTSRKEPLNSLR